MKKQTLKTFLSASLLFIICFSGYSQKKHAIISAYTLKMDKDQGDKYLDGIAVFINEDKTHLRAIENKLPELLEKLNAMVTLEPSSTFMDESYYKYMLDEYESAPENVKFSLTGLSMDVNDPLVLKTDYRMSEHHVFTIGDYLAIGTGRPFNNDEAIELLIQNLPETDAFVILEFSPSISYVGNDWGMGSSGARLSLQIKILNRKNKLIFKNRIAAGSKEVKFQVAGNTKPNMDEIHKAFETAMDNLMSKLDKLNKKLSKLKY